MASPLCINFLLENGLQNATIFDSGNQCRFSVKTHVLADGFDVAEAELRHQKAPVYKPEGHSLQPLFFLHFTFCYHLG